jgi:alpha/beta superfamily hydrolase
MGELFAEDIVTLPTRGGVTQSYLLAAPEGGKAQAVAILFAGGAGRVNLERETARTDLDRGNFLVRSRRLFAQRGVAAAVMDAPSDEPAGMSDEFRLGSSHAEDIAKAVADLKKRYPGSPVFLVGTSRGTISAASAGKQLARSVDGVVLTATLFLAAGPRPGLSGFDFSTIPSPVLFVHHVDDACAYTPYSAARQLADRFPVLAVSGGLPARSKPCEAMSPHGFIGKEAETVDAIVNWMVKRPYPREIN